MAALAPAPRALGATHGVDPVDDPEVDRPRRADVDHDPRDAVTLVAWRGGIGLGHGGARRLARAVVEDEVPSAARPLVGLVLRYVVPVDRGGDVAEAVLHAEGDAGRGVVLELGQRDEGVAVEEGVVEEVGGEEEARARHVEAVVGAPPAEAVRVLELHPPARGRDLPRVPPRLVDVLLERDVARVAALEQPDPVGARAVHEVHDGADHPGVDPVRVAGGQAAEADRGRAGQVELDGDGPALDQPPEPSQLVEHPVERGQELRAVGVALRDRHRGRGSGPGERHQAADTQAEGGGGAGQELPAGELVGQSHLRPLRRTPRERSIPARAAGGTRRRARRRCARPRPRGRPP